MYICQIEAVTLCVYRLLDKPVNPMSLPVWDVGVGRRAEGRVKTPDAHSGVEMKGRK